MGETKFKQTEIGKIPEDWEVRVFSQAVAVNPLRKLKKSVTAKKVSMQNLQEFRRKIAGYEIAKFNGGTKFRNNDTLMARITPCLENGKTSYVDILDNNEVGFGSTEFNVFCGKDGKTIDKFVYYLTMSPSVRAEAINSMVGTSGRQRVQSDIFDSILIPIPSIMEQEAIAKILSDLDSKIELNQQMNKTLEAIGQALFKRWFVDFEFPNEESKPYKSSGGEMADSELGEIPKGWKISEIGKQVIVKGGTTPSTKILKYWKNGNIYWCTPKDLSKLSSIVLLDTERKITREGLAMISSGLLPERTLLLSSRAPIGYVAISEIPVSINQGFIAIIGDKQISNYYMLYWIKWNLAIIKNMAGGSTFQEINKANFRKIGMVLSPVSVLEVFDALVKNLYERIVSNEKKAYALKIIRDSLLPRLMSGKLRVEN